MADTPNTFRKETSTSSLTSRQAYKPSRPEPRRKPRKTHYLYILFFQPICSLEFPPSYPMASESKQYVLFFFEIRSTRGSSGPHVFVLTTAALQYTFIHHCLGLQRSGGAKLRAQNLVYRWPKIIYLPEPARIKAFLPYRMPHRTAPPLSLPFGLLLSKRLGFPLQPELSRPRRCEGTTYIRMPARLRIRVISHRSRR